MPRSTELRLEDIVRFGESAMRFVADKDEAALFAEEQIWMATLYALQCVSEAARHLPDDVRARDPELPWRDIADASNVYRHGYHSVIPKRIVDTVRFELPRLLAFAKAELQRFRGTTP